MIFSSKCLAILCLSSTAPTAMPILALPRSGGLGALNAGAMAARFRSVATSRSSRLRARSSRQHRGLRQTIEPLAGIIGRRDRGEIALVEQRHLQRPASTRLRIAGARSAVIQSSPAGLRSSSMRAWVIMPRSPTSTTCSSAKRSLEFFDLIGERRRIGGVAVEHLDRDWAAVRACTVGRRRSAACRSCRRGCSRIWPSGQQRPFEIGRRHVVEHQRAVLEMASGQRGSRSRSWRARSQSSAS